jgi:3-oxoacyl-[acyl-carrier protein] reductase
MITGTSRGLGEALAKEYLRLGENVVGCSRKDASINHKNYRHYRVDLLNEQSILKMFNDMREIKFVPRLLVNNAAIHYSTLATTAGATLVKEMFEVNILGTFIVSREALKSMQRHGFGRIVNLSSIRVPLASIGCSAYNISKAGIESMGNSFANESKSYDITVNSIGLSFVANTGMLESTKESEREVVQANLLKPKLLEVSEVLAAINFFASFEARSITGQVLYFGGIR